ncbi:MAG: YraN family protein [Paraburkholderia sp.]|nr:YraN family protein [Paraburkholderia sp.]
MNGPLAPRRDNFYAQGRSNAAGRAAERREAGARFESHALAYLQRQRLVLLARNVYCRAGELDLVMRDRDGTLVFVEVRARTRHGYGGAAASVGWHKQQRILRAARYYLAGLAMRAQARDALQPACRFDVVTFEGGRLTWLRDAFREDGR